MKTRRSVHLHRLLLIASLSVAFVARADEDGATASVKLSAPAKPAILRIDMPWANIHITGISSDADTVTVESTLARKDAKPAHPDGLRRLDEDVSFELTEHDNVVVLRLAGDNPSDSHDAEFKIGVPRAMALDVRTEAGGELGVENVEGDIEINNMNGSVQLEGITGSTVIDTVNGEVRAAYAQVPRKLISITSMNGEVDLQVPIGTKANVSLRTQNGAILTDFGEDILKTKSESQGGGYHLGSDDVARFRVDAARAAADAGRAAEHIAHDVAREVERAVQEESDEATAKPAPAVDVAPTPSTPPVQPVTPVLPVPPVAANTPPAPRAPRAPMPLITGGKLVSGTLNGGGVDIKISTMNGEIKLRQATK